MVENDPVPPTGEENVVEEAAVIPPRVPTREEKTLRAEINGHKRVAERNLNPTAGKTKIPRAAKGAIDKSKIAWGKLKNHVLADIKTKSEAAGADEKVIDHYYDVWYQENEEHESWMLEQLDLVEEAEIEKEANKTRDHNKKVVLVSLQADYDKQKNIISEAIFNAKDRLPAEKIGIQTYEALVKSYKSLENMIEVKFRKIAEDIENLDLEQPVVMKDKFQEDRNTLHQQYSNLISLASSKIENVMTSTPNTSINEGNVGGPGVQPQNFSLASAGSQYNRLHTYAKRPHPPFDGTIRFFPTWIKEWEEIIAPQYPDVIFVQLIHEHCPMDLLHCETKEECIRLLKNKYASPGLVCSKLQNDFLAWRPSGSNKDLQIIEIEAKFIGLYRDLKAVGLETQLTNNHHVLQKTMEIIPDVYSYELVKELTEEEDKPDDQQRPLFTLLRDFLTKRKNGLERHAPWLGKELFKTETEKSNKGEKPLCGICQKKHFGKCRLLGASGGHGGGGGQKKVNVNAASVTDPQILRKWEEWGECPKCKAKGHTAEIGKEKKVIPSSRLNDCEQWRKLGLNAKADFLQANKCCSICLSWAHDKSKCNARIQKCRFKLPDGSFCDQPHHQLFHSCKHAYVSAVRVSMTDHPEVNACDHGSSPVLLHLQELELAGIKTTVMWDTGANCSLITFDLAKRLKLKGVKKRLLMTLASKKTEEITTDVYKMKLTSSWGDEQTIDFIGVKEIANTPEAVNVEAAYELFPQLSPGDVDRPSRPIGVLCGQDASIFLPVGGESHNGERVGSLRLMRTGFGTGFLLGGFHEAIKSAPVVYSEAALAWRSAATVQDLPANVTVNVARVSVLPRCYEDDDLGVVIPAQCARCAGCTRCNQFRTGLTRDQQEIVSLVDAGLHLDRDTNRITAQYPVNDKVNLLKNNYSQVAKRQAALEKALVRKGAMQQYNDNFMDAVSRGAIVEVSREDLRRYEAGGGPIHFIGHHAVYKPTSKSSPIRMVADCALKNCFTGPSLNDLVPKPPNSLNDLVQVLYRFRSYEVGCTFDLSKAYNCIFTGQFENFLRMQLWRFGCTDQDWRLWQYQVVAFGDIAASLILELSKNRICDYAQELGYSQDTIDKLRNCVYVDDFCGGGSRSEVNRMVGQYEVLEDGKLQYDGEFANILKLGGFRAKAFVVSGDNDEEVLAHHGQLLGHTWLPKPDLLCFDHINKIKCKVDGEEKILTLEDVDSLEFSQRLALSVLGNQYDPTGLLSPLWIKMKIHMRDIVQLRLGWDTPLPPPMQRTWRNFVRELIQFPRISFPRSIRPPNAVGRPEIVATWDGSNYAYAGTVHVRWPTGPDTWDVNLITAKSRVTPVTGMTTPRSELSGLVTTVRLVDKVNDSLDVKPCRVSILGDSECTIASMEATSSLLAPYFSHRVAEVGEVLKRLNTYEGEAIGVHDEVPADMIGTWVDPICHIPGLENISDLPSRPGATIKDIGPGSDWQKGSPWMRGPRNQWPISREFVKTIPEKEKRSKIYKLVSAVQAKPAPELKITGILYYSNKYCKVAGIMGRYLKACKTGDGESINDPLTPEQYDEVKDILLWLSMPLTRDLEVKGRLSSLAVFWVRGVCYTRGRVDQDSLERILGKDKLPVLSPKSRLAELYMIASHEEDHRMDHRDTLYRSRKHAWIYSGTDLAKRVVANCNGCKRRKLKLQEQRIADLPPEMFQVPCQAFSYVVLDYAGPFVVTNPTRKRSSMKVWVMILNCLNTGNVNAVLCPDYTTDTFLKMLDYHANQFRWPKVIYCDRASNFLAGKEAMEVTDDLPDHDYAKATQRTALKGVEWRVNPAQSQHRTGRAERAVASYKKTMSHMFEGVTLCYTEFQLLLMKSTRAINLRPLGVQMKNSATAGYAPITPLKLIQGPDAGDDVEDFQLDLENQGSLVKRMKMIELIHAAWWKKWFQDCFTGLLPLPRWKNRSKNLHVDDICLLSYNKKYGPAVYRYCRVTKTYPDRHGLVRDVDVVVRPRRADEPVLPYAPKPLTTLKVSVQRLVLLAPVDEQDLEVVIPSEGLDDQETAPTEVESEKEKGLEAGNAQSVDDVLAKHQLSLLHANETGNLVSSVHVSVLDDIRNDISDGACGTDQASHPVHESSDSSSGLSTEPISFPWDSNGNLAMTLGRTEDILHACTDTLCPADLRVLDDIELGHLGIADNVDVAEVDVVGGLIPDDVEVELLASSGD